MILKLLKITEKTKREKTKKIPSAYSADGIFYCQNVDMYLFFESTV